MRALLFRTILLGAVVAFVAVGCDSQTADLDEPPQLLPPALFSIDADFFESGAGKTESMEHFVAAALRVWPVSLVLKANLLIPAAVTAAATQDEPSFIDGAWRWTSRSTVGAQTIDLALIGREVDGGVDWSMRITAAEPILGETYHDFELYHAHTRVGSSGGVEGQWSLYYLDRGAPRNVLNAEFEYDEGADRKSLWFSVPETADDHAGDVVRYAVLEGQHQFYWEQIDPPATHDVRWNPATAEGSIAATNYNDSVRACWGPDLQNVACP